MSDKVNKILTIVFLILSAIAVILYFTLKSDRTYFLYIAGLAIAIRLAQYIMKYNNRH